MVSSLYLLHNRIFHPNLDSSWPASFLKALVTPLSLYSALNNLWLLLGPQPHTRSAGDPSPRKTLGITRALHLFPSSPTMSYTHIHTHARTHTHYRSVSPGHTSIRCNGDICLIISFHGISHAFNPLFGRPIANFFKSLMPKPHLLPQMSSQSLELWFTIFSITIKIFNDLLMLRMKRSLLED